VDDDHDLDRLLVELGRKLALRDAARKEPAP
jgi:hypothetical protein